MNFFAAFLFFGLRLIEPAAAQTVDRDSFEVGIEAFNAGNCKEALRIMKKYEKEQPSAAYIVRTCSLMMPEKKKNTPSYDSFLRELKKGDSSQFDKLGMLKRSDMEINGISGTKYFTTLQELAKKNDTTALFQTGLLYQEGTGTPKDFTQAARYFENAANNGHPEAMNSAGFYYRFGIGVEKNMKKAKELWQKAVVNKNLFALYNLGQAALEEEDFITAKILADVAVRSFDPVKEKKYRMRSESLQKKANQSLSGFHSAYLQKFRPYWMKPLLTEEELKKLRVIETLPFPPKKMIEKTSFMRFIRKDDFDNRYKTFFPLMPSWVDFEPNSPVNPHLKGKKKLAPCPEKRRVISALYFRPSDPRYIDLTLCSEKSAVPVMVGDILTLSVYTPLHETKASLKGVEMFIDNTPYAFDFQNPEGVIDFNTNTYLLPLSDETKRQEAWLTRSFYIRNPGTAVIRFVPRKGKEGEKAFPHSLKIVASQGKPPK